MPRQSETVPLLLCCNLQYAQHLTVCIVSLLENNRDLHFDITALVSFDDEAVLSKILTSVRAYMNVSVHFTYFRVPEDVRIHSPYYPREILARLWISDFIDYNVHPRALYLDSDMVAVSGIRELWHTDLDDNALGAVTIPGSTRGTALGVPEQYGYFNSGLLLIDMTRWVASNAKDRVLELLERSTIFLGTPEQDAMNILFYDHRKCLDYEWNVISPFFWERTFIPFDEVRRRQICQDAKILHFNGRSKPWSYMDKHPRKLEYFKYLQKTEWRDYKPPDRTPLNMFKKHAGILVPLRVRRSLRSWTSQSPGQKRIV